MNTWEVGTKKARSLYAKLAPDRQQELLTQAQSSRGFAGMVMQFDRLGKEQEKVVSVFFDMDLCIDSRYVYLFASDVQDTTKEEEPCQK